MVTATQQDPIRKISCPEYRVSPNSTIGLWDDGIFSPRYRRYLIWKCKRMVGNHHDAEELVSKTLFYMYASYMRGDFASDTSKSAHCRCVKQLKWACINFYRDSNSYRRRVEAAKAHGAIRLLRDVAFPELQGVEIAEAIERVLLFASLMPHPTQKLVVQMSLDGLDFQQIGERINLHKVTVGYHVNNAIAWIRARIPKEDFQEELMTA